MSSVRVTQLTTETPRCQVLSRDARPPPLLDFQLEQPGDALRTDRCTEARERIISGRGLISLRIRLLQCPDACTHLGVGTRRDRFSTIEKRCRDCVPAAAAHSLRECRRAIARWGRLLADFRDSVYSTCTRFMHSRMPQAVWDTSRRTVNFPGQFSFGGLPSSVEHVPHLVQARTRSCTSTSCNKSRALALKDEEILWRCGSEHGGVDESRRHPTAILGAA